MSCCGGNCGCGSDCGCGSGCNGCGKYPNIEFEKQISTNKLIYDVAPLKMHHEGASESGCDCGPNCNCNPCTC